VLLYLAIIGVVTGAMLGKYNVLILVPAIMFCVIVASVVGIVRADSLWSILLMMLVLAAAVQLGYLTGVAIRGAAESIGVPRQTGRDPLTDTAAGKQLNGPPHRPQAADASSAPARSATVRQAHEKEEAS
jgi:hypothetical protein